MGCERNKKRQEKTKGREERFLAVCLPLSDVLFLHPFFLLPGAQWSLSNRSTVFSKAMTIFDLANILSWSWQERDLLSGITSGRFSITGKDKYKIMG